MGKCNTGFVLALAVFCLAACAGSNVRTNTATTFAWTSPSKRVVLVEPDVQLTELGIAGILEPRADWTQAAQGFIAKHVAVRLSQKSVQLVHAEHLTQARDIQLAKLHGVVGEAILMHLYVPMLKLPSKGNALDWTLGPGTNDLRQRYGADYALFVYVRDSYSSGGRQALMILGAVAGVGISGGQQVGFASLVDLRTGNIVWFNRLMSATGDLRTEAPAQRVVEQLIRELPL